MKRRIQMIARLNYAYTINFNGIERDSEHFLRVCGAVKMHRLPSLPLVYRRLSMSFRVVPQPMKFDPSVIHGLATLEQRLSVREIESTFT